MPINKKLATIAVAAGVAGASVVGRGVMAESTDGSYPPIVDKIAAKFNLNKDEVKKVFEEEKAAHQAEHKQKLDERLSQAVKDGKLTEDQKSKLLAKLEELAKERQEMRDENKEEREQRREELKNWAQQNGISLEDVLPKPDKSHGHHGHTAL